jgi:signal transduction histidine kinase
MSNLTQTLLEFAKASGSKGGIEIDLIRMDEIVLKLPSEIQKSNPLFMVKLDFQDLPEEEAKLLVFGNEALLFTAIRNLVVNACKYSQDHTSFLQLKVKKNEIILVIRDNGIGIPPEELSNIFQPFYRINDNRPAAGFGLGLSLAEKIIKIHKGTIDLISEVNKGTTFTVRLPGAKNLKAI